MTSLVWIMMQLLLKSSQEMTMSEILTERTGAPGDMAPENDKENNNSDDENVSTDMEASNMAQNLVLCNDEVRHYRPLLEGNGILHKTTIKQTAQQMDTVTK